MDRIEFLRKRIKGKTLDVGYYCCTLHEEVLKVAGRKNTFGIDTECPKNTKYYKKAKAENIPFKANTFETVVAGELVEHLAKPEPFFKEASRVLKKGGRILITTPNKDSLLNRIFHNNEAPLHLFLFNTEILESMLKRNGFEIEDFVYMPYTMESSPGSDKPWLFTMRKILNAFLPNKLRENLVVSARKIK